MTSDLVPLLAERGVQLSREQVYRLVTQQPERLNMYVLAALCDLLACSPADLIEPVVEQSTPRKRVAPSGSADVRMLRPTRARILPARSEP
jgi:DNA-binding Xre family transcriptional regulator